MSAFDFEVLTYHVSTGGESGLSEVRYEISDEAWAEPGKLRWNSEKKVRRFPAIWIVETVTIILKKNCVLRLTSAVYSLIYPEYRWQKCFIKDVRVVCRLITDATCNWRLWQFVAWNSSESSHGPQPSIITPPQQCP